jgi:hypothetical protein
MIVAIWLVHLLTPPNPAGWVEDGLFYVQRTNEAWLAAAIILLYYATRRTSARTNGEAASGSHDTKSGSLTTALELVGPALEQPQVMHACS